MRGEGTELVCRVCKKAYFLDEYGYIKAKTGESEFSHIPDWYDWEREEVKREIESGNYIMDIPVDICVTVDTKHLYHVGDGRLIHTVNGFSLRSATGEFEYEQRPLASYTLNSDFNWYEIGDLISIGNGAMLYYCFPKIEEDVVTKARLATEEIYKLKKAEKQRCREAACVDEHE